MFRLLGVKKSFRLPDSSRREVLNIADFSFPSKGLVAIVGPSGEGKTTLLNLLSLLDRPDEGSIYFHGEDIEGYRGGQADRYRHSHIGYLRQGADLVPYLTGLENAALPYRFGSNLQTAKEEQEAVMERLKRFGVDHLASSYPPTFSGGEAVRVALCRALALDPEVLLCDEPTASLSQEDAEKVLSCLKEASSTRLVLLVSHDAAVTSVADAVCHLTKGTLAGGPFEDAPAIPEKPKPKGKPFSFVGLAASYFTRKPLAHIGSALIAALGTLGIAISFSLRLGFLDIGESLSRDVKSRLPLSVPTFYLDASGYFDTGMNELLPKEPYAYPSSAEGEGLHINLLDESYLNYLTANLPADSFTLHYDAASSVIASTPEGGYRLFTAGSGEVGGLDVSFLESFFGEVPTVRPCSFAPVDLAKTHDLLYGDFPREEGDLFLLVEQDNSVSADVLSMLGLPGERVAFSDIVGKEIKFVPNDSVYKKRALTESVTGRYLKDFESLRAEGKSVPGLLKHFLSAATCYEQGNVDGAKAEMADFSSYFGVEETRVLSAYSKVANETVLSSLYQDESIGAKLRVTGIIRRKSNSYVNVIEPGLYYGQQLADKMRLSNASSEICKEIHQHLVYHDSSTVLNVPDVYSYLDSVSKTSGGSIAQTIEALLTYYQGRAGFGLPDGPSRVSFPFTDVGSIDKARAILDAYNDGKDPEQQVLYRDYGTQLSAAVEGYSTSLSDAATFIFLIVLSSNLLVALLFAALEAKGRTREIGLYRYLGASRVKVLGLYLIDGLFLGVISAVLGTCLSYAALTWFNSFIASHVTQFALDYVALLSFGSMAFIALISMLTRLVASLAVGLYQTAKNPVDCMRQD